MQAKAETREHLNHAKNETSRIEAFSDGVFAIAITLLILDIHVPEAISGRSLLASLVAEWPSFLALVIGFFTILICWINHHFMFQMIQKSNSVLLLINGLKLLVVTITPFSTALLSKHIQTEWSQSAINIYALTFALMGIAMTAVWCYSYMKGLVISHSPQMLREITKLYIFAGVCSTLIYLVSFVSVGACLVLFCCMFLVFVFPEKIVAWQIGRVK